GQLMPQRPIDLERIVFAQTRIQRNELAPKIGAARGAEKPRVPLHVDGARQFRGVEVLKHLPRFCLELKIASKDHEHRAAWQTKIELFKQRHTCSSSLLRRGDS